MSLLYLDIFSGISGDMFIGAMIDLGLDWRRLEQELGKLEVGGYHLHVSRGKKQAIAGTKFDVHLADHGAGEHHHHADDSVLPRGGHGGPLIATWFGYTELSVFETNVPPRFRLYFLDKTGASRAPLPANDVRLETVRADGARMRFKFKKVGGYLEATEELPEPHEFDAVLRLERGSKTEAFETKFVEDHHHHHTHSDHHEHHHDHGATHSHHLDAAHAEHGHGRNFRQIQDLILRSSLAEWVKEKSIAVFRRIAAAEGKIHGLPTDEVHFHEVGAVDSIVDIVGACIALDLMGRPRVLAGPVVEGTGWINCAHGRFPIPAPATLEILAARGAAISQCDEPHELVTPTGAALLAEFAESFGPIRDFVAERVGFGLGTRDNRTRPNVLRAMLGRVSKAQGTHDWETDTVAVLEANLDDLSPEIIGYVSQKALAEGALDVFHTAIQMKKDRPGVLLTVLCSENDADKFTELLLRETSTFGVRRHLAERRKLRREFKTVETPYGEITVKLGILDGEAIQAAPEFESCRKAAERNHIPLKAVYEAVSKSIEASRRSSKSQKSRRTRRNTN